MTVETLRYLVEANYGQLQAMTGQIEAANAAMGRSTVAAGKSAAEHAKQRAAFQQVGRSAGLVALGIGGIAIAAFHAAAEFDRSMNVFQATSDATARQMKVAGREAVNLGNDIKLPGVSAKDAADAMNELAKGGFNASQAIKAARGVLLLGQAAEIDYADAATIVARSLKAFGLNANDTTKVVNTMGNAALKSTVGIREIADGMAYASTPAHSLGVNFTDTATALAILNDKGIVGASAGSALGIMMTRLAKQTPAATKTMKDLGLATKDGNNVFFDAKGHFVGMEKATKLYTAATKNRTDKEKLAAAQTIFGLRGMRAAMLVMGGGSKAWNDYSKAVGHGAGAQKLATAQAKGMAGSWEQAKNAIQTFAIQLGHTVGPAISNLLGVVSKLLGFLGRFPGPVGVALAVLGGLAAALWAASFAMKAMETAKLVAGYFKLAAAGAKLWAAAQWLLNAAMDANPIVLIVIAILALAAAFYLAYTKSETFRNIIASIGGALAQAGAAIADFAKTVWDALKAAFDWVKANWPLLVGILVGPVGVAVALIATHFAQIKSFITNVMNSILGFLRGVWSSIKSVFSSALGGVKSAVSTGFGAIANVARTAGNAIVSGLTTALRAGVGAARSAVNATKGAILAVWNAAPSWLRGPASQMISNMVAVIRRGASLARSAVVGIKNAITGFFGGAIGWLVGAGRAIVDGLASGIRGAIGNAVSAAGEFASRVKGAALHALHIKSPPDWSIKAGYDIVDGVKIGIEGHAPAAAAAAARAAARIANAMLSTVKGQAGRLGTAFEFAFGQMQAGLDTEAGKALKALQAAHDAQERAQAIADAQAAVAAATSAEELKAAQKQLADAQYQQQVADLQRSADEQQAALDYQKQTQQKAFDAALKNLQTYLESGHATAKGARDRIKKVMDTFGIDLSSMGNLVGQQFASSVEKMIPKVVAASVKLARAVKAALNKELHGSPWVTFTMGKTMSEEMARGLESSAGLVGKAVHGIVPQPSMRAPGVAMASAAGAGGSAVNIDTVNVATDLDLQRLSSTLSTAVAVRR